MLYLQSRSLQSMQKKIVGKHLATACGQRRRVTVHPDELCCCQRPLVALLELLSLLLCCGLLHTTEREATSSNSGTEEREEEEEKEGDMCHWAHCCCSRGRLASLPLLPLSRKLIPLLSSAISSIYAHILCARLDWCIFLCKNLTHTETFTDVVSSLKIGLVHA